MSRGDPKRVRVAVRHKDNHIGYATTVSYPDRQITAYAEGLPYSEVVVSDLRDKHVALLQRYKEHWLIHCGTTYGTTEVPGELSAAQVQELAAFALQHADQSGPAVVAALRGEMERMLGGAG